MLEQLREFFRKPVGMAIAGAVVVVGLFFAIGAIRGFVVSEAEALSSGRVFIDAATGKPYNVTLEPGMAMPAKAPSGGNTGYPAEACYWMKDGKEKKDPTHVLLNIYKTPPSNEPTFCPDCNRLVVGHNPRPGEGSKPPPTKEEYAKSPRRSRSGRQ